MSDSTHKHDLLREAILKTAAKAVAARVKKFSKKEKAVWAEITKIKKTGSLFFLSNPKHQETAAKALSLRAPMIYHFGNFIAIASHPNKQAVQYVNSTKGRDKNQVGSITTTKKYLQELFDWSKVPKIIDKKKLLAFIDELGELGPFGFRGPATNKIPKHLSRVEDGINTVQIIMPGWKCPSNNLIEKILKTIKKKFLYATSPNLSHHLTGKKEESAHYRIHEIQKDFGDTPGYFIISQEHEDHIQEHYPNHEPMSTSIIAFHKAIEDKDGNPCLTLERHGSLHVREITKIARRHGFVITKSETAKKRLLKKYYLS